MCHRSFERSFASQCLMVLAETMEARKPAYDLAIRQCISSGGSFGTGLYQLLHLLLTRFLVLSRDDLELWEAEPNQFIFEDLASSFVYKLNVRSSLASRWSNEKVLLTRTQRIHSGLPSSSS